MIEWHKINTVFLDMDGTLLDLHYDNYFWREYVPQVYAQTNDISVEQAKEKLFPLFQRVEGTMEWYCVDYWSQTLDLDIAQLKRNIKELIQIHPFAMQFLEVLKQTHHRVVLLTNAHHKSLMLKMETTRLTNHFDRMISTHEIGLPKENDQFWDKLQQIEPFDKHAALLVDDSLAVLQCAKRYGLGYLLAISRPDSKGQVRDVIDFEAIANFSEVIPQINVLLN